jgi:hypothetical protein
VFIYTGVDDANEYVIGSYEKRAPAEDNGSVSTVSYLKSFVVPEVVSPI